MGDLLESEDSESSVGIPNPPHLIGEFDPKKRAVNSPDRKQFIYQTTANSLQQIEGRVGSSTSTSATRMYLRMADSRAVFQPFLLASSGVHPLCRFLSSSRSSSCSLSAVKYTKRFLPWLGPEVHLSRQHVQVFALALGSELRLQASARAIDRFKACHRERHQDIINSDNLETES